VFTAKQILSIPLLPLLVLISPAYGAPGRTVADQIKSFDSKNFGQSAAIGAEVLRSAPTNATARYYFAQALVKLNRQQEAIAEFSKCYNTARDPTMKSYSYTALQNLLRTPATASATSVPASDADASSNSNSNSSSNSNSKINTLDASVMDKKLQILEEGKRAIEVRRTQMNSDIRHAKERALEQMQGIPQFIEIPIFQNGWRVGSRHVDNPNYQEALGNSQRELAAKTEQANKDFERRETEITEDCKRKTAVYDQVSTGLKSQQKPGTSQIQLTPQNSSVYVRHFVNYDGSQPVGIKTRQQALPLKSNKAVEKKAPHK